MFHHSVIHNTCIAFPRRMDNCLINQKYINETVTSFKILWSVWESDQQPGHTTMRGLWRQPTPSPEDKQEGACPRLVEIDCLSWLLETHIKGSGRGVWCHQGASGILLCLYSPAPYGTLLPSLTLHVHKMLPKSHASCWAYCPFSLKRWGLRFVHHYILSPGTQWGAD